MAQALFTSEQLARIWYKHASAKPQGTRSDVVLDLMNEIGMEDNADNRKRMYNNVTQRKAQLETQDNPVEFPGLAPGKKGARRTAASNQVLRDILAGKGQNVQVEETMPDGSPVD